MTGDRYKTFIEGFDEHIDGGIPQGHVVLVAGTPGTMKSSLMLNLLYRNAQSGTESVYLSLEQSAASLKDQMVRMAIPMDAQERVRIVDLGMIRKSLTQLGGKSWLEIFRMYVQNLKVEKEYQILVLDSLPALELIAGFENPREDLFHLFEWLRDMGITTFLISEMTQGGLAFGKYDEAFLSDGVIHVAMVSVNEIDIERRIRCVKMRSSDHHTGFFTLMFKNGKFFVARALTK